MDYTNKPIAPMFESLEARTLLSATLIGDVLTLTDITQVDIVSDAVSQQVTVMWSDAPAETFNGVVELQLSSGGSYDFSGDLIYRRIGIDTDGDVTLDTPPSEILSVDLLQSTRAGNLVLSVDLSAGEVDVAAMDILIEGNWYVAGSVVITANHVQQLGDLVVDGDTYLIATEAPFEPFDLNSNSTSSESGNVVLSAMPIGSIGGSTLSTGVTVSGGSGVTVIGGGGYPITYPIIAATFPGASKSGDTLTLTGDDGNDVVTLAAGRNAGEVVVRRGPNGVRNQLFTGINSIVIDTLGGNDRVSVGRGIVDLLGQAIGVHIDTGAGNDRVTGGDGNDTINTGDGDDNVTDRAGDNVIDLGAGRNRATTGDGNDQITGGDDGNRINDGGGNNSIELGDGHDNVRTGAGNDHILTSGGNDRVVTSGGDNVIDVGAGDNRVNTGSGNDEIYAFDGNDVIVTRGGNNTIGADDGDNRITTGAGDDEINAGNGNDRVNTRGGDNVIHTAGGDDHIRIGGAGVNFVDAGTGNDRAFGGRGADVLIGGLGDDILRGNLGDDELNGGDGNDQIDGGPGADLVHTDDEDVRVRLDVLDILAV